MKFFVRQVPKVSSGHDSAEDKPGGLNGITCSRARRTTRTPQDGLPLLTVFRGMAAFGVFIFHVRPLVDVPGSGGGYVGVAFFFVLSGFILTWSTSAETLHARQFWWRRIARIWPAHLVVLFFALIVPLPGQSTRGWSLLASITLTQAWFPREDVVFGGNGPSWSLACEAFFYATFPLWIRATASCSTRTFGTLLVAFWSFVGIFVVIVASNLDTIEHIWFVLALSFPVVRLPEFLFGILIARLVRSNWRPSKAHMTLAIVFVVCGYIFVPEEPALDLWAAPLFGVIIAIGALRNVPDSSMLLKALIYLGSISFSFYLVQGLIISHLAIRMSPGLPAALASLLLSLIAASLLYHSVEVPARRALIGLWKRRS